MPARGRWRLYTRAVDFKASQGCIILILRADLKGSAWEGGLDSPQGEGGCKLPGLVGPLGENYKAGRCKNLAALLGIHALEYCVLQKYQK